MEWRDEATVLSVRKHGEGSAVVECFVRDRGRWAGLVRGAGSPRLRAALQPGNLVEATWRARLADQLGNFAIETLRSRAADWMSASLPLHGLNWLVSLARLLPERDPHPAIHDAFAVVLEHLGDASAAPALFARFELAMLAELGFGLSLAQCALTGATEGLAFVSPRTGRAATAAAGAPFAGKLFALPGFLLGVGAPEADDVAAALRLTGHFLARDVYLARGLPPPDGRRAYLAAAGLRLDATPPPDDTRHPIRGRERA